MPLAPGQGSARSRACCPEWRCPLPSCLCTLCCTPSHTRCPSCLPAGVLLNQLLPNWAVTFLLIPLLGYLTQRMCKTALRLYEAETSAAAAGRLLPGQEAPHPPKPEPCGCCGGGEAAGTEQQAQQAQQVQQGRRLHSCAFPWLQAAELGLLWAVLLAFQHAKAHSEGLQFAALYASQAATAVGASAFFIWQVRRCDGFYLGSAEGRAERVFVGGMCHCGWAATAQGRLPRVAKYGLTVLFPCRQCTAAAAAAPWGRSAAAGRTTRRRCRWRRLRARRARCPAAALTPPAGGPSAWLSRLPLPWAAAQLPACWASEVSGVCGTSAGCAVPAAPTLVALLRLSCRLPHPCPLQVA